MPLKEYQIQILDANNNVMSNFPIATRYVGKDKKNNKLTSLDGGFLTFYSDGTSVEVFVLAPLNKTGSPDMTKFKEDNDGDNVYYKLGVVNCKFPPESMKSPYKLSDYGIAKTKIIFFENNKNNKKFVIPFKVRLSYLKGHSKESAKFIDHIMDVKNGELSFTSILHSRITIEPLKPDNTSFKNNGNPVITSYYPRTTELVELKMFFDIVSINGVTEPNRPEKSEPIVNSCGMEFKGKVKCTQYGKIFGPVYWGKKPISTYTKWDELIAQGKLTNDDKIVLLSVAPNEGEFDAVQSYDSEIITAGAMQKTVNSSGTGELPEQIFQFKEKHPDLYESLFANCGWVVSKSNNSIKAVYNGLSNTALKSLLRQNCSSSNKGKVINCSPVESMVAGVSHPLFIDIQIVDFIKRLNDFLNKIPIKYKAKNKSEKTILYNYKIKAYIKSHLGKATVLDHSINRPGHVTKMLGDALNDFFKNNPTVDENPENWGEKHAYYENKIVEYYGKNRKGMTDPVLRFNKTKKVLATLLG